VFENGGIFEPKRDYIIGGWRKVNNEELHNFHSLANITTSIMIKSRRMRLAGHVARMGERRKAYKFLVENLIRMKPVRRPRRSREITLKRILGK
jgi:hypothetical protein